MTTTHALDDAPLSAFHKRLAFSASGGPFLDGYVLSIIGVAMVHVSTEWGLTTAAQGVVGISSMLGIFVGGILGGRISDLFGRRIPFTVTVGSIAALSLLQFFVDEFVWLLVLRVLIGVAIGADYPIATSLLTEFSPNRHRGPVLGFFVVMWFVGAAAYVSGQLLTSLGENNWRWMLVSSAAPAVLFLLARAGTPESLDGSPARAGPTVRTTPSGKHSDPTSRSRTFPTSRRRTPIFVPFCDPDTAVGCCSSRRIGLPRSFLSSLSTHSPR